MLDSGVDYIDIFKVCEIIKKQHKLETLERTEEILDSILSKGIRFKDRVIKVIPLEYDNLFSKRKSKRYFFSCPICNHKAYKILSKYNAVGCVACIKINTNVKIRTDQERILKIHSYIYELLSNKSEISSKRKKQLIDFIITHYDNLGDKYKKIYNTFVLQELKIWCREQLGNKYAHNDDYKKAIKDILTFLNDVHKIFIKTKMVKRSRFI